MARTLLCAPITALPPALTALLPVIGMRLPNLVLILKLSTEHWSVALQALETVTKMIAAIMCRMRLRLILMLGLQVL